MSDSNPFPNRRSVRVPAFDYSRLGQYFVTVYTFKKQHVFGSITHERVNLNPLGLIAQSSWAEIPNHFPSIDLAEFIVMPNHLHAILTIACRARLAFLCVSHRQCYI